MKMKHILIVDDDIHINEMLEEVLKHERYTVSHAYSGTEALLFLTDRNPDLILLDLMLPGLSGENATGIIRRRIVAAYSRDSGDCYECKSRCRR